MKKLYVVHCVDTEGPLYESLEETFSRINSIFGFKIHPSKENLIKLQNKEINLKGKEDAVKDLVRPERVNMNKNWSEIDEMLEKLNSDEFRTMLTGDINQKWVFNWFCLDHVGFTGENPRRRDLGDHKIFDKYVNWVNESNNGDLIQWHYHPLPVSGNVHNSGTAYLNSNNVWEILAKKIIEKQWFPSVYRPGFHTIRPDSNWFIDQWFPFDFSNQSLKGVQSNQPDLSNNRYGDWLNAPDDWSNYNPSYKDYQIPGDCFRYTFRCLNAEARLRVLSDDEITKAFERSNNSIDTVLSFTNHDFRDMHLEVSSLIKRIKRISKDFKDVKLIPTDALTACRKVLNLKSTFPKLSCSVKQHTNSAKLVIKSYGIIHGIQPFLAIRLKNGSYVWENFDKVDSKLWTFTFDDNHIPWDLVEKIGIAANSPSGITEVNVYDKSLNSWKKRTINEF
jgi:hypothetical protein